MNENNTNNENEKETLWGAIPSIFIDLGYSQRCKAGESICGDSFKFQKSGDLGKVVAVLSDGLGSGVKANILASMTATMALKFASEGTISIVHAAEIMMSALPICQVRKISYATFTIVNASLNGATRVIEMGNPNFILFREGESIRISSQELESPHWQNRTLKVYNFYVEPKDRLIFFSDGISQAGMGSKSWPLGWRVRGCSAFIKRLIQENPDISAFELSERVLYEARRKDPQLVNKDDMTCAVLYFRRPRQMILFTGPPFDKQSDSDCAALVRDFQGDKVVSGGTTAEIISRELNRKIVMDLKNIDPEMPPCSTIEGIDLVTEGIFTLTKTVQYLEEFDGSSRNNAAGKMVEFMLRNDIIDIMVGTKINEAHQDPKLSLDLELRRNVIKRIARLLENKFLKKVNVKYV